VTLVQAGYSHAGIGLPRPASPAATFLVASAFVFVLVVMIRLVPIAVFPSHIRNDLTFNLEPQAVVWGGAHSGLFHYFRGHQAARIHYAPEELQDRLTGAIAADGVSQILVFSINVLTASSALARGFSPAQRQGFFVIFSTV
jgi:hypothetical protein